MLQNDKCYVAIVKNIGIHTHWSLSAVQNIMSVTAPFGPDFIKSFAVTALFDVSLHFIGKFHHMTQLSYLFAASKHKKNGTKIFL